MERFRGALLLASSLMVTGCFEENSAFQGPPLSLEIVARKDYRPSRWTDGSFGFEADTRFKIPARLDVLSGTAGNHKSFLYFKKAADGAESRCEYRGGSSQANPKGQKELDKGKAYHLVKCDGGLKAESIALAKDLRLRVDHGGNSSVSPFTVAQATIIYEGARPTPTPSPAPTATPTPVATSTPPPTPTPSPTPDIFAGLPPDPGEAGKATLLGVDADADGVRDELQRWTVQNIPSGARVRALTKIRQARFQIAMTAKSLGESALVEDLATSKADGCLYVELKKVVSAPEANRILSEMEALEQNTQERFKKSMEITKALSGSSIPTPTDSDCAAIE